MQARAKEGAKGRCGRAVWSFTGRQESRYKAIIRIMHKMHKHIISPTPKTLSARQEGSGIGSARQEKGSTLPEHQLKPIRG